MVYYLINCMPTHNLKNCSPYEILFISPFDYSFLSVFCCTFWPNLHPYNAHKFQPRSLPCVFLGYKLYCPLQKGCKSLHIFYGRIYISRDVQFDELLFPFKSSDPCPSSPIDSNVVPLLSLTNITKPLAAATSPTYPSFKDYDALKTSSLDNNNTNTCPNQPDPNTLLTFSSHCPSLPSLFQTLTLSPTQIYHLPILKSNQNRCTL